jgi:hypothetical protein
MAKFVLKNASLVADGVNLSDHVRSVTVESTYGTVDVTAMGDTATQLALGLPADQITVDFYQDFAAASVDATLQPRYAAGSAFVVSTWASGTVTSATNPKYSATCIMLSYQPIAGEMGAAAMTTVVFNAQGAIQRATS